MPGETELHNFVVNMHTACKKIFILTMLMVFLFNIMGYYILFEVRKQIVRAEMERLTSRSDCKVTILRIADPGHDPAFKRIHKKEFLYRGQLYDIVLEKSDAGGTTFYCIHDTKEDALYKALRKSGSHKITNVIWAAIIKIANGPVVSDPVWPLVHELIFARLRPKVLMPFLFRWCPPPRAYIG